MESNRMTYQLNPDYFIMESDDKIKMREFVPQRKVQKTIRNICDITKQNADTNDFLPDWVTEEYFSSLHESKETKNCGALRLESDHIKNYVQGIIEHARNILQEEEATLRSQNSKLGIGDIPVIDDCIKQHRDKMAAVHEELLMTVKSKTDVEGKRKCEEITKKELADEDHGDIQSMQSAQSLEDRDDFFIPRQLFLFKIETFKSSSQSEDQITETDSDVREPRPSQDSTVDETVTRGKGSRCWRKRILRFFGFK
ncbi:uncharacterized protein LOC130046901 [Ostrea edulis]|uniref:uncharacterized protein LOC130046901 n=1 Tax=Ostrea edulis TaxID=37623 RepID=UPI0024AFC67A|nr:uncharacterized protein LOC130046901 [Ostrea edulis]